MSWDAYLVNDRGHSEGEWNYTHNCNGMIEAVLGDDVRQTRKPWWSEFADAHGGVLG